MAHFTFLMIHMSWTDIERDRQQGESPTGHNNGCDVERAIPEVLIDIGRRHGVGPGIEAMVFSNGTTLLVPMCV